LAANKDAEPPSAQEEHVVVGETTGAWREWALRTEPEEAPEEEEEPDVHVETIDDKKDDADAHEPDTVAPVDRPFLQLQERLRWHPNQVLRYYRIPGSKFAAPLWVSNDSAPGPSDVAHCPLCGRPRTCEFQVRGDDSERIRLGRCSHLREQVMSTLLAALGLDDMSATAIDFGTVAVYTCEVRERRTRAGGIQSIR
jgi:pre-rRNA-processing protein TSR4